MYITKATIREVAIVERIIGSEVRPTLPIVARLSPKPSRITAYCRIFFEVKAIPSVKASFFLIISDKIIPAMIAITGAPITSSAGTNITRSQEGTAIARQSSIPKINLFIQYSPFNF